MDKHRAMCKRIQDWTTGTLVLGGGARSGLSYVSKTDFISIHIDELLPELRRTTRESQLDLSIQAFYVLIDQLAEKNQRLLPSLTVYLKSSSAFKLLPPNPRRIVAAMDSTPPSLYVNTRARARYLSISELYIRPFDWPIQQPKTGVIYSSYRIGRNPSSNVLKDDYVRYIELEYYPQKLMLGSSPETQIKMWSSKVPR